MHACLNIMLVCCLVQGSKSKDYGSAGKVVYIVPGCLGRSLQFVKIDPLTWGRIRQHILRPKADSGQGICDQSFPIKHMPPCLSELVS